MGKNLLAVQGTWFHSLGWEDPLEKRMATHCSPCLENPRDRGAWGAVVHGVAKSKTRLKRLCTHTEANTLQFNCLSIKQILK